LSTKWGKNNAQVLLSICSDRQELLLFKNKLVMNQLCKNPIQRRAQEEYNAKNTKII